MSETIDLSRRRNIVLSYMREGMPEGEAVRAADKLMAKLDAVRQRRAEALSRLAELGFENLASPQL